MKKVRGALERARRIQRLAARQGFDWPSGDAGIWRKLQEEIRELRTAIGDRKKVREELGDLLFMAVNVARHLEVDPEVALDAATRKFERRFAQVMRAGDSLPPIGSPDRLREMDRRWRKAKARLRCQ